MSQTYQSFMHPKISLPQENLSQKLANKAAEVLLKHLQAHSSSQPFKLYFSGEIGSGKTSFIRYLLKAFGVQEAIKSPTYTLIERYEIANLQILHADLYRIHQAEELFDLDLLDDQSNLWLIEWPEQGLNVLPNADLLFKMEIIDGCHHLQAFSNCRESTLLWEKIQSH